MKQQQDINIMVAARCRICMKEKRVVLKGDPRDIRKKGKDWLYVHLIGRHSADQIIQVYCLGQPWYEVASGKIYDALGQI